MFCKHAKIYHNSEPPENPQLCFLLVAPFILFQELQVAFSQLLTMQSYGNNPTLLWMSRNSIIPHLLQPRARRCIDDPIPVRLL